MSAGGIAQSILLIMVGVFIIVFSVVILRSDTWVDIITDQLLRRRPRRPPDRRRLASWVRAVSVFPIGVGGIFVALGIASVAVGLWG
jgi:hypothetical protein